MPVFDIALMVTGAVLMLIGIVLMVVNRKASSGSINKIEGFGIKLDIANPSLLLIFAGIGMMLVPRFFPDPNIGPATASVSGTTDQAVTTDPEALANIQPAAGTGEQPPSGPDPEQKDTAAEEPDTPVLLMAAAEPRDTPLARAPATAAAPNTTAIQPSPVPPLVAAAPNTPALPPPTATSGVVMAKSDATVTGMSVGSGARASTRPSSGRLAAIAPSAAIKPVPPAPKVAVLVRAIPRNEGSRSAEIDSYSGQLGDLLEDRLKQASPSPLSTRTQVLAAKQLRRLQGEGDGGKASKALCERMQTDALFVTAMEPIYVSDSYGFSYWREPEFVFYDCRRDRRVKETVRVEEKGQDRFPFETDLAQRFDRFARPHLSGLQSTP